MAVSALAESACSGNKARATRRIATAKTPMVLREMFSKVIIMEKKAAPMKASAGRAHSQKAPSAKIIGLQDKTSHHHGFVPSIAVFSRAYHWRNLLGRAMV